MKYKYLFFLIILVFLSLNFISAFNFPIKSSFNFETNEATSNVSSFLDLNDTPNSYIGEGGNCIVVNTGETGLEFGSCGNGTATGKNPFDQWLNTTDSPVFDGLTLTGQLIMQALINSQSIIPVADNLYSLGNLTNRFSNIYADNVDTASLTADDIGADTIDTNILNATNVSSTKVNISGYEITDEEGDLTISLT